MTNVVLDDNKTTVIDNGDTQVVVEEPATQVAVSDAAVIISVVENPVQIIVPADITVVTQNESPLDVVSVGSPGPQGAVGPQGPPGISSGPSGPQGLPILDARVAIALAAGSSVDLDSSSPTPGKTGYLLGITYSSSAACKWQLQTIQGGVAVLRLTRMTSGITANPEGQWASPGSSYVYITYVDGTERFRMTVTNLDDSRPADAYVEMYWDEV